ncbi:MAG: PQQ-like beta-propeller repeat protein [Streptomycetaceae bacterium]|nr:PQQ-like beta-propeller repeat protein [Streptomycetaceae bacterium]
MNALVWERRRFLGAGVGAVAGALGLAATAGCDSSASDPDPLRGVPVREPSWHTRVDGYVGHIEVRRDRVFGACSGTGLVLLDRANGRQVGQVPAPAAVHAAAPNAQYLVGAPSREVRVGVRSVDTATLAGRWAVELPGTENAYDVAAVADADTVYVAVPTSASPYPARSADDDRPFPAPLYAVDAADGRTRWTARTMGALSVAPTGDAVCFVDDSRTLVAVHRTTGEKRWTAPLFAPGSNPAAGSLSKHTFLAVGDTVYVSGPGDGLLRALDGATGQLKWTFTVPPTAAPFPGDRAATRPPLRGLGPRPTGALPTKYAAPTVVDGTVYLAVGYALHAVDAATGTARWSTPTTGPHTVAPVVAGDLVVTAAGYHLVYGDDGGTDDDGDVYALDAATGRPRWQFHTGSVVTELTAVPGGIAVSWDGNWCVLDAATGRPMWRIPVFDKTRKHPFSTTVSDGFAYIHLDQDIAAVPL